MFEKFTAIGANDFKQRYQGTYGFFTRGDKKYLTRLENVYVGGQSYVEFVDRNGMEYKLLQDSKEDNCGFEFIPPKCAFYNTKEGSPRIINRIPARQYQRGICDRNTSIKDLIGRSFNVDFKILAALFEEVPSIAEALAAAIKSSAADRGVAISPQFAVGLNEQTIKCFNTTIGRCTYDKGIFTVTLESPELWQQEIKDAFSRAKLEVVFK